MMERLLLDSNEATALFTALENYLNGNGMLDGDCDEQALEGILEKLS